MFQLKIKDVHIRYEDDITIKDKVVAFGVTMDSLSAQNCECNSSSAFSQTDNSGTSLEMKKLSVYWTDLDYSERMAKMNIDELRVSNAAKVTVNRHRTLYNFHFLLKLGSDECESEWKI